MALYGPLESGVCRTEWQKRSDSEEYLELGEKERPKVYAILMTRSARAAPGGNKPQSGPLRYQQSTDRPSPTDNLHHS